MKYYLRLWIRVFPLKDAHVWLRVISRWLCYETALFYRSVGSQEIEQSGGDWKKLTSDFLNEEGVWFGHVDSFDDSGQNLAVHLHGKNGFLRRGIPKSFRAEFG